MELRSDLLKDATDEGRWAGFEVLAERESEVLLRRRRAFRWVIPLLGLFLSLALAGAQVYYYWANSLPLDPRSLVWNGLPFLVVVGGYLIHYLLRREERIELALDEKGELTLNGAPSSIVALRAKLRPPSSTRTIAIAGVMASITIILGASQVGFIPVPTPAGHATIVHIPVIVGGILEGWTVGGLLGLIFGLLSFLLAQVPVFKDPLVAIVPRLFIGVTAYFTYRALRGASAVWTILVSAVLVVLALVFSYQIMAQSPIAAAAIVIISLAVIAALLYLALSRKREAIALAIAAVVGTLTNTVLVLGVAALRHYWTPDVALAIGITHGIPEVVVAVMIVLAVLLPWREIRPGS